jgi:hypothetical protein
MLVLPCHRFQDKHGFILALEFRHDPSVPVINQQKRHSCHHFPEERAAKTRAAPHQSGEMLTQPDGACVMRRTAVASLRSR